MAILQNPESEYSKELAKFEQYPQDVARGLTPGNPYVYREFPKMLYMARQTPSGKWQAAMSAPLPFGFRDDNEYDRAVRQAEQFNASCRRTVNSEDEERKAKDEGWRESFQDAMAFRQSLEDAVSKAAAERNYRDRNMSEKALAESAQAEEEHFGHLPEIPEKPRARRGRPPKAAAQN